MIIICCSGHELNITPLFAQHKPNHPEESKRITASGGKIAGEYVVHPTNDDKVRSKPAEQTLSRTASDKNCANTTPTTRVLRIAIPKRGFVQIRVVQYELFRYELVSGPQLLAEIPLPFFSLLCR